MAKPDLKIPKFKALADDNRLAILKLLYEQPRTVTEITTLLDLEQSLVSHHLRILKDTELVEGVREGKSIRYQLAPGLKASHKDLVLELECCRILLRD